MGLCHLPVPTSPTPHQGLAEVMHGEVYSSADWLIMAFCDVVAPGPGDVDIATTPPATFPPGSSAWGGEIAGVL